MDLFSQAAREATEKEAPLAARMRPRTLDEYVGQEHIVGPGRLLRRAIEADQLSSLIFYGPPGTGKTTLARIIANTTKAQFLGINAVLAGVKDIREAIVQAQEARAYRSQKSILFVDEVHRFNKAQQDALLPHVENGTLILIGATTENPYFEVNKALVSRSRIFQLRQLEQRHVEQVLRQALSDLERGYGGRDIELTDEARRHLVQVSGGDARAALNALELAVETTVPDPASQGKVRITLDVAEESIQKRAVLYDKDGDAHYDTISAFIKSLRGSDPDAALYWMAKMLYAGEDPRFIFRRMIIFAGEDVGLADPNALRTVMSAAQAYDYVGMPEGQFHLSEACLYLATAPKSNSAMAFFDILAQVQKESQDDVPDHLRDGNRDKEDFGHGKGYLYPHAYRDHWVAQQYLPGSLQGKVYYEPSDMGYEKGLREGVLKRREQQLAMLREQEREGRDVHFTGRKPSDPWLRRAWEGAGDTLGKLRDRMLTEAKVERESLVLDLCAGSGLLTWEALRRSPAGGVWTRCRDEGEGKALAEWCEHFQLLDRPHLLSCPLEDLGLHLTRSGTGPVFDAALCYGEKLDKDAAVWKSGWSGSLRREAQAVLAVRAPGVGQKLSELLVADGSGRQLRGDLIQEVAALETDFAREGQERESLPEFIGAALALKKNELIRIEGRRRFRAVQLKAWIEGAEASGEGILGHLHRALDPNDWSEFRSFVMAHLPERDLAWKEAFRLVVLQKL